MEFLKHLIGIIALFPVLPFVLVWLGYRYYTGDRKKAIRVAMDATTIFLIGCVAALYNNLFNNQFGLYGILLLMLLTGGILGNAQYRKKGAVHPWKIIRSVWRLTFFAMAVLYVPLMIVSLVVAIIQGN